MRLMFGKSTMLRPYFGYLVEPDQSMTSTRGGRFASQKADCCSAGLELDRALRGLLLRSWLRAGHLLFEAVVEGLQRCGPALVAGGLWRRRTFSMAMTTCFAKLLTSSICLSVKGRASRRRTRIAPIAVPS